MGKRVLLLVCVALLIAVLALPGLAMAVSSYSSQIPSSYTNKSCSLCHGTLPALNDFGQKWVTAGKNWSALESKPKSDTSSTSSTKPSSTPAQTNPAVAKPSVPKTPVKVVAPVGITEAKFAAMLTAAGYYTVADNPLEALTKDQAIKYLTKGLGMTNAAKLLSSTDIANILKIFKDQKDVANPAYTAVAVSKGFILGYAGNIRPGDLITPGQAARIIAKVNATKAKIAALPNYVGSKNCSTCHAYVYKSWKGTLHSSMLQDLSDPNAFIVADFRTLDSQEFTKADLLYAVAQGQRFVALKDGKLQYVPMTWNVEQKAWVAGKWSEYTCYGCHTTGYNEVAKAFVEPGIGCESCHGPGAAHVISGGDPGKIKVSNANDMCAPCHSGERQIGQLEEMGHTTIIQTAMAERGEAYFTSGCFRCHSSAYKVAEAQGKALPTKDDYLTGALKNDREAITCAVCHDPHKQTGNEAQLRKDTYQTCAQCHTNSAGDIASGSAPHHPQRNIIEGQYSLNGAVMKDMPTSGHRDCINCHMTNGNHLFEVGTPKLTLKSHGADVVYDSCSSCHDTMTQARFDAIQKEVEERLLALKADYDALVAAAKTNTALSSNVLYKDMITNYGLTGAELSFGVHNPALTEFVLTKLEKDIPALMKLK